MRISQSSRGTAGENRPEGSLQTFYPLATVKCDGPAVFRSQRSRDVACLLDVDPLVSSWRCMTAAVDHRGQPYVADFFVFLSEGQPYFLDGPDRPLPPFEDLREANETTEWPLVSMSEEQLRTGFRLTNAKDLLRYGSHRTPLGDRVRLLAALDEYGSLSFGECLSAFQEAKPVAGMASLILQQYVEVDLDGAPLGPETIVRRIAR